MTYTVIWLEKAKAAFEQQKNWYLNTMGRHAAKKFTDAILKDADRLANSPHLGQIEPILEDLPERYRSLVCGKHFKLVYFIEETTIYIVAIRDCRQSPGKLREII